jgi:hypothetical protein
VVGPERAGGLNGGLPSLLSMQRRSLSSLPLSLRPLGSLRSGDVASAVVTMRRALLLLQRRRHVGLVPSSSAAVDLALVRQI